jgi:caffeoyl-CoA O-methyltransferase
VSIFDPALTQYLETLARREADPLLEEMLDYGREKNFPLIGPEVGRFLAQLTLLMGARRIFEMGSGFGYSALWFSRALPEDGEIYLTDGKDENIDKAREFLARDGQDQKAVFLKGYAQDLLQTVPGFFDILFCDMDKEQYPEAMELARTRLRVGGALVIDNLIWSGDVADPENDELSTRGIRAFTDRMWGSKDFACSLLPIRDGVGLCVRLK